MKNPFATPNQWKRVLFNLYIGKLNIYKDYNILALEDTHPAKDIMMKKENFVNGLYFLKEHNLVEIRDDDFYYLTNKGFNVAFELEKQIREEKERKRNGELQLSLVFLTFILTLTGIANLAKEIYPEYGKYYLWFYLVFIASFFIGVILGIKRKKNFNKN
jgi:hypothetical protein